MRCVKSFFGQLKVIRNIVSDVLELRIIINQNQLQKRNVLYAKKYLKVEDMYKSFVLVFVEIFIIIKKERNIERFVKDATKNLILVDLFKYIAVTIVTSWLRQKGIILII